MQCKLRRYFDFKSKEKLVIDWVINSIRTLEFDSLILFFFQLS